MTKAGEHAGIYVEVESTGLLHIQGLEKGGKLKLRMGATVSELLEAIKIQRDHQKYVVAFVNGVEKTHAAALHDGDKVTLLLPVGGG